MLRIVIEWRKTVFQNNFNRMAIACRYFISNSQLLSFLQICLALELEAYENLTETSSTTAVK